LDPGLHTARISAFDTSKDAAGFGPLFSVPITICKPETSIVDNQICTSYTYNKLKFFPGEIIRKFVHVPAANFVDITLTSQSRATPATFILHTVQLLPSSGYDTFEHHKNFSLNSTGVDNEDKCFKKITLPVQPNVTMEICLAQFWSSLGSGAVSIDLKFHSVSVALSTEANASFGASFGQMGGELAFSPSLHGFQRVDISSHMRTEFVNPKLSFTKLRKAVAPKRTSIQPLFSRDILQNVFAYNIENTSS
jgi:tripeptidyl-peptidase II